MSDISILDMLEKCLTAAKDLEKHLKSKSEEEQIKWFKKKTKERSKTKVIRTAAEWKVLDDRFNYGRILEEQKGYRENRKREAAELKERVDEILKRNPDLKVLLC